MSNKEKLLQMTQQFDESQLAPIVAFAEIYFRELDEALDDAFCEKLLKEALEDPDNEEDYISEDEVLMKLGISKDELQN